MKADARPVFGKPTHLDILSAKMLLDYGPEDRLAEDTVIRGMTSDTIALSNRYLVERPSELFLNGKFNAEDHIKRGVINVEDLLSGAYERTAVDNPIKLRLYGLAKAQKIFVDCMLNLLYADMPEKEMRERASAASVSATAAQVFAPAFVSVPRDLGLKGLARYRELLATIVREKMDAEVKATAARLDAEAKAAAKVAVAKKAQVDAFVRRFMTPKPKPKPKTASPPVVPRSEPWYTQVAKAIGIVPRVVAGGTRKQKRSRKVE